MNKIQIAQLEKLNAFLSANIDFLLELVKRAGHKTLEFYRTDNLDVEYKADFSPVTKADKAANKILCDGLAKFDYPIISEENSILHWSKRQEQNCQWIIDPLDGTKAFVKGEDEFTINLAFLYLGKAIFGVIYAPVLDELCWAVANKAFWSKAGKVMELAPPNRAKIPRVFVSRSSGDNIETNEFLQTLGNYELVKASSSWKFCEIAKGNADIYPRFGTTSEWDIAAGHAILNALGGKVLNAKSNLELAYNKENLENPHFIASI